MNHDCCEHCGYPAQSGCPSDCPSWLPPPATGSRAYQRTTDRLMLYIYGICIGGFLLTMIAACNS